LRRNRPPLRYSDYISNLGHPLPRVHLIVAYSGLDGAERAVEVQLRTTTMHEWAITVERLSGRLDVDLKSGRGPDQVLAS